MNNLFKQLWTSSPADLCDRVRRRARRLINRGAWDWDYSLDWVLKSPKHMDPKNYLERWERYWRVLGVQGCSGLREKFSFQHQEVLELGCGPLLGFGPIAFFNGAKSFRYHEPGLRPEVVASDRVRANYFVPMHEELVANYGPKMSFDNWYRRVIQESKPADLKEPAAYHLVLSNSVMEHIRRSELGPLLRQLRQLSAPGGCFFHAVDFGPHGLSGGLQRLYETTDHQGSSEGLINLLRLSEMEKEMEKAGFQILKSVAYKFDDIDRRNLHKSWQDFSAEDLGNRVSIMIGTTAS